MATFAKRVDTYAGKLIGKYGFSSVPGSATVPGSTTLLKWGSLYVNAEPESSVNAFGAIFVLGVNVPSPFNEPDTVPSYPGFADDGSGSVVFSEFTMELIIY